MYLCEVKQFSILTTDILTVRRKKHIHWICVHWSGTKRVTQGKRIEFFTNVASGIYRTQRTNLLFLTYCLQVKVVRPLAHLYFLSTHSPAIYLIFVLCTVFNPMAVIGLQLLQSNYFHRIKYIANQDIDRAASSFVMDIRLAKENEIERFGFRRKTFHKSTVSAKSHFMISSIVSRNL